MAALDKSIYEEIIITSADGSKTVDIAMGSLIKTSDTSSGVMSIILCLEKKI